MNQANLANPDKPEVGKHVYLTLDGKIQTWGTIAGVNDDGTLDINVHDSTGRIVGGLCGCAKAEGMNHSVPNRWWT